MTIEPTTNEALQPLALHAAESSIDVLSPPTNAPKPRPVRSTIVARYQITVPSEVRDLYALEIGDVFEWTFEPSVGLILIPKKPNFSPPPASSRTTPDSRDIKNLARNPSRFENLPCRNLRNHHIPRNVPQTDAGIAPGDTPTKEAEPKGSASLKTRASDRLRAATARLPSIE